jgi:SpoVK/Ycf46/Vps4 family AAA+-type ATPase
VQAGSLDPNAGDPAELAGVCDRLEALQAEIDAKLQRSLERGIFLALPWLARLFALSPFELQAVVICLAPELRRKYDTLYAYLQDDVTRKKPSVDLVLDLLCDTEADRWRARTVFSDHAPLFRAGLLHTTDDPQSPSGRSDLARFLKLDPRILSYLLEDDNGIDGRLSSLVRVFLPSLSLDDVLVDPVIKEQVLNLARYHLTEQDAGWKRLALYLHGPYGVGKRDLALGICGELGCPMLIVDMNLLLAHGVDFEAVLRLVFREGLLMQAALYFDHADVLVKEDNDGRAQALIKTLVNVATEYGWLTFLAGEKPWSPKEVFKEMAFQAVELPLPGVPLREAAWVKALESLSPGAGTAWAEPLARRFRLTPGQIQDAAAWAENRRAMGEGQGEITLADLYAACRAQSNQKLGELTVKIEPCYGWEDIILPEDKVAQLREICNQVKHRYRVFGQWGFDRKLSRGKGLSVLFSGPPGTGKTMAAEVIAYELQLDLYKIDLSGVVSKYVGETEKNLARIFAEAETANAILFFDEADALFGKRTLVSDAHDRYANVETSYLLQRMEEYDGVVILATNMRENMDEAFTRRIRFVVEFPFPDAASRMEIWRTHFPREAPVGEDVDYELLSEQFQIAGGSIRNIVVNAAFFAADDGGRIDMAHVMHGARREFEKMGKLWNEQNVTRLPD